MRIVDVVTYAPDCPQCGMRVSKPVAWLAERASLPCPDCGGTINLRSGRHGTVLKELVRCCARADGTGRKRH